MKRRREWKVILLGLAVVGFLFLLSSTDLFFEEEREEIYTISVIQDENDSRYQNLILTPGKKNASDSRD